MVEHDGVVDSDRMRRQLERLVVLLETYASSVLTERPLQVATGGELTPAQYDALVFIAHHSGCSAKALSEGLRISIPSATRLVDRLVRKQMVDRREGGEDRRLVDLSVTPAGLQLLIIVHETRIQSLQQALETLQPDEREQFPTLLERFLHAALRDEQTVNECCLHCGTAHDRQCVVNAAHQELLGRPIEHT